MEPKRFNTIISEASQKKWEKCLQFIRDNVGDDEKFGIWFGKTTLGAHSEQPNEVTIDLPSDFFRDKYENEFYSLVTSALRFAFGDDVKLFYEVGIVNGDAGSKLKYGSSNKSRVLENKTVQAFQGKMDPRNPAAQGPVFEDIDPQLNSKYNFENYCVGQSNRLPFTIAESIANHPERSEFNPFFLYGDVGVGKTHLIQAVGIRIKEMNPAAKVLYVTMRHFINQYRIASQPDPKNKGFNHQTEFIQWYQNIDVLLMDDIQELSGNIGTMKALFPIFNHLHHHGKKLLFTCDRAPSELEGLEDRLIDRFKWGITERLEKPDFELRKKILRFKSETNGLSLPEDIIEMVAKAPTSSVRELEGIVMGIMTRAIRLNCPITPELAREEIAHCVKLPKKKNISFDLIVDLTADRFNLNVDVIYSKSRQRDINDARQIIMLLARRHTDLSTTAIGRRLNRDHSTVVHGVQIAEERLSVCRELQEALASLEKELYS